MISLISLCCESRGAFVIFVHWNGVSFVLKSQWKWMAEYPLVINELYYYNLKWQNAQLPLVKALLCRTARWAISPCTHWFESWSTNRSCVNPTGKMTLAFVLEMKHRAQSYHASVTHTGEVSNESRLGNIFYLDLTSEKRQLDWQQKPRLKKKKKVCSAFFNAKIMSIIYKQFYTLEHCCPVCLPLACIFD